MRRREQGLCSQQHTGKELQLFRGGDGDEGSRHSILMPISSPTHGSQAHQWALSCPGPTSGYHWAMLLWVATALPSRATSPAVAMAHPTTHPCPHHSHSHVLTPRSVTPLRTPWIPIPAPTTAWTCNAARPAKSPVDKQAVGKASIAPGDTEVATPNRKSSRCCLPARGWLQTLSETSLPLRGEGG